MSDETFASKEELLDYQRETVKLANANLALSESNWANIVPWRWIRWFKTQAQVGRNHQEVNRRLKVGQSESHRIFGSRE